MTRSPPRAVEFPRRRFLASGGATAAIGLTGCADLRSGPPEPARAGQFRTSEPIVFPSQLYVADGNEFMTVTRVIGSEGTPRFRESYLDEYAEGYRWILDLDFDRYSAVVIEVVLPEYQELADRQVAHGNGVLSYSFHIQSSETPSNAVLVTHVLDVWDRAYLSGVDAIEVELQYRVDE